LVGSQSDADGEEERIFEEEEPGDGALLDIAELGCLKSDEVMRIFKLKKKNWSPCVKK